MSKKLNWNFILKDRCPVCRGLLSQPNLYGTITCLEVGCPFRISSPRFNELLKDMIVKIR